MKIAALTVIVIVVAVFVFASILSASFSHIMSKIAWFTLEKVGQNCSGWPMRV